MLGCRAKSRRERLWLGRLKYVVVLTLLVAGACEPDPASVPAGRLGTDDPASSSGAGGSSESLFYPLAIGNRWQYDGFFRVQLFDLEGNLYETLTVTSEITNEITGTEMLAGREYVLEKESGVQDSPFDDELHPWVYWVRYRQDRSGLYEADVGLTDPPGPQLDILSERSQGPPVAFKSESIPPKYRAAFVAAIQRLEVRRSHLLEVLGRGPRALGPLTGELTRLQYPLRPGATWKIRQEPDLVIGALVEGHAVLDLPAGRFPAWRIRILWEVTDPLDVLVWYGSSGFLQMVVHSESEAIDYNGNHVGTVVSDETRVLQGLELIGHRGGH